jgi:hypothetical protein
MRKRLPVAGRYNSIDEVPAAEKPKVRCFYEFKMHCCYAYEDNVK